VDLVTVGTAFHFMDPVQTLSALRRLTGDSGAERWERVYEDDIDADFVVGHIFSALSPDQVRPERRADLARAIRNALPRGHARRAVPVRAVTGRP
jgi:hypothetical protein